MATCELVPLRSKYPYAGHMTVRYAVPVIDSADPQDLIVEDVQDILDSWENTTTSQVAAEPVGETAVRKGVQAR